MDLELKILKEKVTENDKSSGIGNLFDDEKTSHQHIDLLKTKYAAMRREFDRKFQELGKKKLNVKGEQFVYSAQLEHLKNRNLRLKDTIKSYQDSSDGKKYSLDKELKDLLKIRQEIEAELRSLENARARAAEENYRYKMKLDGDKNKEEQLKRRHDKFQELSQQLVEKKQEEIEELETNLETANNEFLGMTDL